MLNNMPEKYYENEIKAEELLPVSTDKAAAYSSFSMAVDAQGNILPTSSLATSYTSAILSTFGGDGTDGALSIASGTTTIDLGSATFVVKNYTSISITGTAKLAFSNPNSAGTFIVLKSQGDVTITSSTVPCLDASGMGAAAATNGAELVGSESPKGAAGSNGTAATGASTPGVGGGAGSPVGAAYTLTYWYTKTALRAYRRSINLACGSGGGAGGNGAQGWNDGGTAGTPGTGGAGGRGGAVLIIECRGAWNYTTASGISVAGADGSAGTAATAPSGRYGGAGGGGGGGGGGAGMFYGAYTSLTSNSGTVNTSGGAGGAGGAGSKGGENSFNHAGGGGGGSGTGGGSYTAVGGTATAGKDGVISGSTPINGSAGGASGGNGAGGGGGSGGGGGGDVANGDSTGGAAGAAGGSDNTLVVQNTFFA